MTESVHIYDLRNYDHTREDDMVLPPDAVVHTSASSPSIAYVGAFNGEVTICVRGPFAIHRYPDSSPRAYFLRHPKGKEA